MILFAGPPGAGKSAQAEMLAKRRKIVWLSMGSMLRATKDEKVKQLMLRGELVGDDIVHKVLVEAIDNVPHDHVVLLDGYPRNENQIKWFLDFVEGHHRYIRNALHIMLPQDKAIERLLTRGRPDDNKEVIQARYDQYEREILPMLEHMERLDIKIHEIDGDKTLEEVHDQIMIAVGDELNEHDDESKDRL